MAGKKIHVAYAKKLRSIVAVGLLVLLTPTASAADKHGDPVVHSASFLSKVYTIDRIYKSMQGPSEAQEVKLFDANPPELLWIVSYKVEIVGPDGKTPVSQEFMCHNNLDFNPIKHQKFFGWSFSPTSRIFTLSQGQFSAVLPKGFGVPVMSNEEFTLATQVLNHNYPDISTQVRHKVTVGFVRDKDLKDPFKPLFPGNAFVMALLEGKDGFFGLNKDADGAQMHAICLPGQHAPSADKTSVYTDPQGRAFSGHWVVKPGKEVRHTLVTRWLNLPYDTSFHYIAVHVHPFCKSLELRDLTTGKTLFKSRMRAPKKGIGLDYVDFYSSKKGIPVFKNHEYEMVSVYDNTSGVDQDSMATFFFYLLDKEFKKPTPK